MPDTPYAEQGARLRARRKQLQESGALTDALATLAEKVGVSVSGFQQWERGETWPKKGRKAKLAVLMKWTEQELDFGPQPEAGRQSDMASFHPVNNEELEVLALFRGLADEKQSVIDYLRAKLAARHVTGREVRGKLSPVSDAKVEKHIPAKKTRTR